MTSLEAAIEELSMQYRAADLAHQNCLLGITDAVVRGDAPSKPQLDAEVKAARATNEARIAFLAAITAR